MPISFEGTMEEQQALNKLKALDDFHGERYLRHFLDRELIDLRKKVSRTDLEQATGRDTSDIRRFAHLLVNERNADLFNRAIKLLAISKNTNQQGLFYKYVYQSGNKNTDPKKLKKFFTTIQDNNDTETEGAVSEHHILKKLKSDNIFDILKAFIALILREYMLQKATVPLPAEDPEKMAINEELKRQWQENRYNTEQKKIDFNDMLTKANTAHTRLKEMGILQEGDNSRHSSSGSSASINFVKLFIRYLQRSFPKLDSYVKLSYYPSMTELNEELDVQRVKRYWNQIKNLVSRSKTEGTIYLIFNQWALKKLFPESAGHANLTIVCNGTYRVFDSIPAAERTPIGDKDYNGNDIKVIPGSIQADRQNCVNMVLGYMESLMKQMSIWIEKYYPFKTNKKVFAKYVWNKINQYSEVKLPDDIEGANHKPLKELLPPKYIRYIQTSKGRDKLIELTETEEFKKLSAEEQKRIQKVVAELKKVRDKNDLSERPLKSFLKDVAESERSLPNLEIAVTRLAAAINKDISTIKYSDLKTIMGEQMNIYCEGREPFWWVFSMTWKASPGEKALEVDNPDYRFNKNNNNPDDISWDDNSIVDIFAKKYPEKKSEIEKEFSKTIYQAASPNPTNMKPSSLAFANDQIYPVLRNILRMNDPAQMRRRRNLLKIATLVDVLEKHRKGSETIQDKVRDEVGKVDELLESH